MAPNTVLDRRDPRSTFLTCSDESARSFLILILIFSRAVLMFGPRTKCGTVNMGEIGWLNTNSYNYRASVLVDRGYNPSSMEDRTVYSPSRYRLKFIHIEYLILIIRRRYKTKSTSGHAFPRFQ